MVSNVRWKPIFNSKSLETPKHECHSSWITSSLGYYHSFNSNCPKLHIIGQFARRPMVCITSLSTYRRTRRKWPTEHGNLMRKECCNIFLSNKFRFSVHADNRLIFIWRERGTRNEPAYTKGKCMIWQWEMMLYSGIYIDCCTDLNIIQNGALPVVAIRMRLL